MNLYEREDLYRQPSIFDEEVLEAACHWADEIRPGLMDINGFIPQPSVRTDEISPLSKLELRVAPYGITSDQSLAELAFIGLRRSRQREMEKNHG
jgi:hypothetical protein